MRRSYIGVGSGKDLLTGGGRDLGYSNVPNGGEIYLTREGDLKSKKGTLPLAEDTV